MLVKYHGFPIDIDGFFGRQTQAAVIAFQQRRGLPVTGAVDQATLRAIIEPFNPAPVDVDLDGVLEPFELLPAEAP